MWGDPAKRRAVLLNLHIEGIKKWVSRSFSLSGRGAATGPA